MARESAQELAIALSAELLRRSRNGALGPSSVVAGVAAADFPAPGGPLTTMRPVIGPARWVLYSSCSAAAAIPSA